MMVNYQHHRHHQSSTKWNCSKEPSITLIAMMIVMVVGWIPSASANSNITWDSCEDDFFSDLGIECGRLQVPLNYSQPNGQQIELALYVRRSQVPDEDKQGVMFIRGSSVYPMYELFELIESFAILPSIVTTNLAYVDASVPYDLVAFDTRGSGYSLPSVICNPDFVLDYPPNDIPDKTINEQLWLTRSRSLAKACTQIGSSVLRSMSSTNIARDIESIRVALGEDKITYYGYGDDTYVGEIYATLYPNRIRRMVLDSPVDPRQVWNSAYQIRNAGLDRNLKRWFRWAAQYNDTYGLGATECEVEDRWNSILRSYRNDQSGDSLSAFLWVYFFNYVGYSETMWDLFAYSMTQIPDGNDFQFYILLFIADNLKLILHDAHLAVVAMDAPWPTYWNAIRLVNWRAYAKAPVFTWQNTWHNAPLQYWPVRRTAAPFNVSGSGVESILLISQTLDAVTPYQGALEIRRRFPNAKLVAVTGGINHANTFTGNTCVDDVISAYLINGTLPSRQAGDVADVACVPLPEPTPDIDTKRTAASKGSVSAKSALQQVSKEKIAALRQALSKRVPI